MIGEFPGIGANDLDEDDNLRSTADFRDLYRALLGQWFAVDPTSIVPGPLGSGVPDLLKP